MHLAKYPSRAGPMFMPGGEGLPGIRLVERSENSREPAVKVGTIRGG